jgi:hypothetical protein
VDLYRQAADESDWAPVMGRVVDALRYVWKREECAA